LSGLSHAIVEEEKVMAKSSYAAGGKPVLGKPLSLLQKVEESVTGSERLYDPDRDVMQFFPHLMKGAVLALRERRLPVLHWELRDKAVEDSCLKAIMELLELMKGRGADSCDELTSAWVNAVDPVGAEILLKVLGRGLLDFYFECQVMIRRDDRPLPGDLDKIIEKVFHLHGKKPGWIKRTWWWLRSKVHGARKGRTLAGDIAGRPDAGTCQQSGDEGGSA